MKEEKTGKLYLKTGGVTQNKSDNGLNILKTAKKYEKTGKILINSRGKVK